MDAAERIESAPEPIAIARYRQLLGDEAMSLSDDDVRELVRRADAMARILIALATRDRRVH